MGLFKKSTDKQEKPITITGTYFSSHPDVHGYKSLGLDFSSEGVLVHNGLRKKKYLEIKRFGWDEIVGFETDVEEKTQMQTTQRITATRMVTLGIFSLAAQKKEKSGRVREKFLDVLHTTTGDIELEAEKDSGSMGGDLGSINRSMATIAIAKRKTALADIRRMVAEKATGQLANN